MSGPRSGSWERVSFSANSLRGDQRFSAPLPFWLLAPGCWQLASCGSVESANASPVRALPNEGLLQTGAEVAAALWLRLAHYGASV